MIEQEKQRAALASLKYIKNGMRVGLGTGSTARYLIDELGVLCKNGLDIQCVPTSNETAERAKSAGIPLRTLHELPTLDVTIDGADQFDPGGNLIKGGHGALVREKVVAAAAERLIIIVDSGKQAKVLSLPVPVEVLPFATPVVANLLRGMKAKTSVRMSETGEPFVSDQGNPILDADFGQIADPKKLGDQIAGIPGVVGHGLFCGMTDTILLAHSVPGKTDAVETITFAR